MTELNETVKVLLSKSGWRNGRKTSATKYKELALREGYHWFDAVDKFLSEFGGLQMYFHVKDKKDLLHFDAIKAMLDIDPLWIKEDYYSRLGNKNLCPIGQSSADHMTLMMDIDGFVYGGYDETLYFIGRDSTEAIEAICLSKELTEVG